MNQFTKENLVQRGKNLVNAFCLKNSILVPSIQVCSSKKGSKLPCGYYQRNVIAVAPDLCAEVSLAEDGRYWSFPGYKVDRTPYGVIAHELGHHIHTCKPSLEFLNRMVKEPGITSRGVRSDRYEFFAEMFRVWITNPDLLRILRPETYSIFSKEFNPVIFDSWGYVLRDAPLRIHLQVIDKSVAA